MSAKEIQKLIDSYHYWDARVIQLNCDYFADETELIYKDEEFFIVYRFVGCYKSHFDHDEKYNKDYPVREMRMPQIPYFLQKVEVNEKDGEETNLYICKINLYPLYLEIWCKDIQIMKVESI